MANIGLRLALSAALLSIVFPAVGCAQEASAHALARKDLEAKIHYCKDCHGQSGQGFSGAHPIPRLAGQTIAYAAAVGTHSLRRTKTTLIYRKTGNLRAVRLIRRWKAPCPSSRETTKVSNSGVVCPRTIWPNYRPALRMSRRKAFAQDLRMPAVTAQAS